MKVRIEGLDEIRQALAAHPEAARRAARSLRSLDGALTLDVQAGFDREFHDIADRIARGEQ